MFGTVTLTPNETRVALTVPTEAIIRTGRAERVILKIGEGTFTPRLITTGLRDDFDEGGRTEVVQGLAPGDEVVASAQFLIDSESALSAGLMRMAPTDAEPARGAGELLAFDPQTRMATIRHAALDSLGWPAMDSSFPVRSDVRVDSLMAGQQVAFQIVRGADGLLALIDIGSDDGVAATGNGVIEAVTADGLLTMNHDPIPELGWPAMRMDMPVTGFDPDTVPLGDQVSFDLAKDADGMFVIVAVRPDAATMIDATAEPEAEPMAAAQIVVSGTIDALNATARTATISHGPISEIGMPGMTMDFVIHPSLDAQELPTDVEVALLMTRNPDFSLTLVGVEASDEQVGQ